MKRALISFANGAHEELLEIALPSFQEFADRHGYDLLIPDQPVCTRPPSWYKVAFLLAALRGGYDEALWLDADMVIVDPTDDLDVPAEAWQALVEHHTGDGDVPNCGMWFVGKPMIPILEKLWGMQEFIHGPWWEQSAMHELLGYENRPVRQVRATKLAAKTCFLDNGWNWHPWDKPTPDHVRIAHATMWPDRTAVMKAWDAERVSA